jgi:uncharacterized protein (DUF58 family)
VSNEPLFDSAFLRKLDRLVLLTRSAMVGDMQGERRSKRYGSSVEFADFRPYTVGDDIRQVDWKLYARMERFFLKLFVAEEEMTVHLLLDSSASMDWGDPNKLAYARRLVAAFGYIALSSLDLVTVMAFGLRGSEDAPATARQLPGVRGKRSAFALFSFLQSLAPGGRGSLAATCHHYLQRARTAGPLLLCSDLLDDSWEDALRTLSSRPFEITLLHVLAPQELTPQLEGDFRLIDTEDGTPVEITADLDLLTRYRQNLDSWLHEVENFCQGRGITYMRLDTSLPVEEFILSNMRERGVLR